MRTFYSTHICFCISLNTQLNPAHTSHECIKHASSPSQTCIWWCVNAWFSSAGFFFLLFNWTLLKTDYSPTLPKDLTVETRNTELQWKNIQRQMETSLIHSLKRNSLSPWRVRSSSVIQIIPTHLENYVFDVQIWELVTLSSLISVAHTKWFLMISLLILRKEDGGRKDFGESNSMYHLTWKFWFYQVFFSFSISMDPSCSFLDLLDSWV